MHIDEANQLSPGIYVIYWKDDGSHVLASIGSLNDGTRWYAPAIRLGDIISTVAQTDWDKVLKAKLLFSQTDTDAK